MNITPAEIANLDAACRKYVGKPLGDCDVNDLMLTIERQELDLARHTAELDQATAAAAEVRDCGCTVRVPVIAGERQIGSVQPNHTCGRTA